MNNVLIPNVLPQTSNANSAESLIGLRVRYLMALGLSKNVALVMARQREVTVN